MKLNAHLLKSTVVGALGGLLFGFDTAVISGTTASLTQYFHLSANGLGITVFSALIGTIIGAIFAGIPSERLGRREAMRIMALLYVISAIGCAFAWNWPSLLFFRVIGGLGIGGSSVIGPMYIAELSPPRIRGRLVGTFQINIVLGILLAYLSNYIIVTQNFGSSEWRWQLGVATIPAAIFLILLFTIPQSPRWLTSQDRIPEAREVLGLIGVEDVQAELEAIRQSVRHQAEEKTAPLFVHANRLPIFLAVTAGMFNQLSGINAILYYLNDIFQQAGFSKVSGNQQAVAVGFTNLIATLIGMSLIDKAGRKVLLEFGAVGMVFCLAGVGFIFQTHHHAELLVWLLMAFIAFFAVSQGAVVWVYISEVFPNRVRAKGQSLGSSSHWIMNGLISLVFPIVAVHSRALPFYFFALMMAVQFFIVLFIYPETKNTSLEKVQQLVIH